jgi:hypothetical protein
VSSNGVSIGTSQNPLTLDGLAFTITVPCIFHIVSTIPPNTTQASVEQLVRSKILPSITKDYNYSMKDSSEYQAFVNNLFGSTNPTKKQYYLSKASVLYNIPVTWNFVLDSVIFKPYTRSVGIPKIGDDEVQNNPIYKASPAVDPDNKLNIWIANGTSILGIARFPFNDRITGSDKMDPSVAYRHGVIINSSVFFNPPAPYNLYKTFSHEIGHYFGLLHTFDNTSNHDSALVGAGVNNLDFDKTSNDDMVGDLISDTPYQAGPTFGTVSPTNPKFASIFNLANPPLFVSHMDYTDDSQLLFFTHMQMLRIIYFVKRYHGSMIH